MERLTVASAPCLMRELAYWHERSLLVFNGLDGHFTPAQLQQDKPVWGFSHNYCISTTLDMPEIA